jgi:predicted PurR-regulated permease PerM
MKRITAVAIVTLAFIGAAIFSNFFLKSSADNISEHIKGVETYAKSNDWPRAANELYLAKENWNEVKNKWAMLIDHNEIDNIGSSLSRTTGFVSTKNLNDVLAETSVLKLMIEHIPEKDLPSIKNIL